MTHYLIWPSKDGVAVCYLNHRGELIGVMDCPSIETAALEAAAMTARSYAEASRAGPVNTSGNRYMRAFT
jgi:hypothetical protein